VPLRSATSLRAPCADGAARISHAPRAADRSGVRTLNLSACQLVCLSAGSSPSRQFGLSNAQRLSGDDRGGERRPIQASVMPLHSGSMPLVCLDTNAFNNLTWRGDPHRIGTLQRALRGHDNPNILIMGTLLEELTPMLLDPRAADPDDQASRMLAFLLSGIKVRVLFQPQGKPLPKHRNSQRNTSPLPTRSVRSVLKSMPTHRQTST
jgi:hypothetical protein